MQKSAYMRIQQRKIYSEVRKGNDGAFPQQLELKLEMSIVS